MSDLEQLLREIIETAQKAQELSWGYPNPYSGIPSPITTAIIQIQRWGKDALGEVVAVDLDMSDDKKVSGFSMQTQRGYESGADDTA